MDDCAFCRIAEGDKEAHRLYEDEHTVAFLDQNPAVEGHALVIPKGHHEELLAASAPVLEAVTRTARTVASAMQRTLDPEGFSVFHTSGPLVGTVSHAHLHLLPRQAGDDISLALTRRRDDTEEIGRVAARIRERL